VFLGLTASKDGHTLLYSRVDPSVDDLTSGDSSRSAGLSRSMAIGTAVRRPAFPEAVTGRAPASVGPLVQSNSFVYRSQMIQAERSWLRWSPSSSLRVSLSGMKSSLVRVRHLRA